MKKRLCLLALCLAALLGLSLFFVACDDEPAPGPTPTPVEHTHSYTSVTIAMADYMGTKEENAGKFIKDVVVPCSGEDCDSTLTLTKDELNAVLAAIKEDVDAADYTAKVEGGNYVASFKVTKGEYTVTVNVTQPHTHHFLETTISFDEYIDEETWTWKKPLEVSCFDSPIGCTGKLTFTVEELNDQSGDFEPSGELGYGTLTKDGHTVYVTVTGVPASEGPDEPAKSPFSITVKIGQEGLVDDATYTYCVGTTVAYTVTVTDRSTEQVVAGEDLQYLSATYQIGDGDAQEFTQQAANFTFDTVGLYTIEVKYDNGEDYPATFTCTVEVSEHEGTYHAATSATCTKDGTIAYVSCSKCRKYFKVTGTADDYTIGEAFDYNNGEGIINQEDPAKGHSYTAVDVAYSDVSADSQWTAEVVCGNGCDAKLTLTMDAFDTAGWTLDTENGYQAPSHNADGQGNYYKNVTQDEYNVKVTVTGVTIPANGEHTYAYTATAAEYEEGSTQVYCTYVGCDQSVTVTLPGLTAGVWQKEQTSAATCTAAVVYTYTATVENVKVTVTGVSEGDPLGHDLEWKKDETKHWQACARDGCNYTTTAENHTLTTKPGTDCHYQTCETCGYVGEQQEHVGNYTYDAESKDVLFTCSVCEGTVECAITGIDVTAETGAYMVDNGGGTYTAYGFTVEAVYDAVAGNAATEIIIPAEDWTATPQGSYKAAVEFAFKTLKDEPDGTFAVYADELDPLPGAQTLSGYQPTAITLGSFKGEFVYHIELDGTVAGTASYESWLIQVTAGNGASAVLRADNYVLDNFGRKADELGADVNELDSFVGTGDPIRSGDIVIDIVRTFDVASGIYKLEFTVTDGINVSTYTITEPATNGNSVTVYLGGENCSYTVAGALYAEKGLTVKSVQAPAEPVNVSGGTSLEDALQNVTVTVSYMESTLSDTVAASACDPVCVDYDADTTGDYIVTLTYGGKTTQVTIHVDAEHVHDFAGGVCGCGSVCTHESMEGNTCTACGAVWTTKTVGQTIENPTKFETWYEFPAEVVLTKANSKIVVTGTQTTALAQLYHTVLWECKQGFTGRFDNFGWTFEPTSCGTDYTSNASIVDGENTYMLTGVPETDDVNFWPHYREIASTANCAYSITFEWTEANALTVTVVLSASDKEYTNVYTLPITNSSVTEWTFHLTAEAVTSFTVADYSMYIWE